MIGRTVSFFSQTYTVGQGDLRSFKYPDVTFSNELLNTVMKAEKELAAKGDTNCHSLGEFLVDK